MNIFISDCTGLIGSHFASPIAVMKRNLRSTCELARRLLERLLLRRNVSLSKIVLFALRDAVRRSL
jgi:hypothetical protein